jgi:hypothetical protein
MNGGWLRVVGFVSFLMALGIYMFPICGSSSMRALWSPYPGVWVYVCVLLVL